MPYRVTTWDVDKQDFTPQVGVHAYPWSKWGLRKALRMLRALGYYAKRDDSSTLVERIDGDLDEHLAWEPPKIEVPSPFETP